MSSSIKLNDFCLLKILFHAAKFPECAVNGILLGPTDPNSTLIASDYIPLFHATLNLAPMFETALYQIEWYCQSNNLRICGYFQANEHIHRNTPNNVALKIGEKLLEKCGNVFLLILNNDHFSEWTTNPFSAYTFQEKKLVEMKKINMMITSNIHQTIIDFDDHLNDVSSDFLNKHLCTLLISQ